ncbi:hypothetical protein JZ751_014997 [Albula glossodonta]|uniref:trypsin n=1 Tax=Albula glossodonta TaxID=121402 RepID=A0A8T2MV28_9TELE|nr:hypothetical protein JZ751_014997 [Albula glossodonta]
MALVEGTGHSAGGTDQAKLGANSGPLPGVSTGGDESDSWSSLPLQERETETGIFTDLQSKREGCEKERVRLRAETPHPLSQTVAHIKPAQNASSPSHARHGNPANVDAGCHSDKLHPRRHVCGDHRRARGQSPFQTLHGSYKRGRGTLNVMNVTLGAHSSSRTEKEQQQFVVARAIPHSKFNCKTGLNKPARLNQYVKILALPKPVKDEPKNTQCTIAGWGLTQPNGKKAADKLMEVNVKVVNRKECGKIYKKIKSNIKITSDMLCAWDEQGRKDTSNVMTSPL